MSEYTIEYCTKNLILFTGSSRHKSLKRLYWDTQTMPNGLKPCWDHSIDAKNNRIPASDNELRDAELFLIPTVKLMASLSDSQNYKLPRVYSNQVTDDDKFLRIICLWLKSTKVPPPLLRLCENGFLGKSDGHHRLCVSLLLNPDSIPCWVTGSEAKNLVNSIHGTRQVHLS